MAVVPLRIGLIAGGLAAAVAAGSAVVVSRRPSVVSARADAPAPVAVSAPAATPTPEPTAPTFDVVRVAPSGNAVLAGRAEPLATVAIESNGQQIGQARADSRGEWVFLPPAPLPSGTQQLALVARNPSNADTRSAGDVVLVVPDRPTPSAAAPPTAPPEPVLAVVAPPVGPVRILQGPTPAPAGRLTLDVVDYDSEGQIRFTGAGPADAPVRVYVDNAPVGDARTDAAGHWSLQPGTAVKPGVHALRVDQIGDRGQVLSRVELPFQRADLPNLEAGRVVVQPGQNLWRLARQAYGAGIRYTVIYRANQDQIRNPARIYPGQAFNVPSGS